MSRRTLEGMTAPPPFAPPKLHVNGEKDVSHIYSCVCEAKRKFVDILGIRADRKTCMVQRPPRGMITCEQSCTRKLIPV
jgi:hypothetical protein